jgi:hypothetical protein
VPFLIEGEDTNEYLAYLGTELDQNVLKSGEDIDVDMAHHLSDVTTIIILKKD